VQHFGPELTQVLNSVISVLVRQETATWGGCDLGNSGVWDQDYGWGVRVRRHFAARGMSSVRYGIRLGDLKENWFLCFPIKNSTHTDLVLLVQQNENFSNCRHHPCEIVLFQNTKVGPPERDKTDRSQELNDGLGEALAQRLNGIY
jgi:hypothetical protein